LAFCLLAFTLLVVRPQIGRMTHGFVGYYTASRLMWQGDLTAQAYDDEWFSQQVMDLLGEPIGEILTPTIPTVAWVTLPLVGMPPQTARDSWIWLNLAFLLISLALILVALCHRPANVRFAPLAAGLMFVALLSPAVHENFRLGQGFVFFLIFYGLAFLGLVTGRDWLLGIALGLMMVLKTVGIFLWLIPLLTGRWRALLWGGGTILAVMVGSLPWIGPDTWLAYGRAIADFGRSPSLAVTAFQTTTGFFNHLFHFDPTWNPAPLVNVPLLATWLPLLVLFGLLGVTVWLGRSAPAPMLFAALVPLSTILLPKAEEYHFVFFLLPAAILGHDWLARQALDKPDWRQATLLVAALLFLLLPVPYESSRLTAGGLAFLAYPRLYSGLLLWLLAIWRMVETKSRITDHALRSNGVYS
jgi:hypothetical protein